VISNYQIGTAVAKDRDVTDSLGYALRQPQEMGEIFTIDRNSGVLRVAANNSNVFQKKRYEVSLLSLTFPSLPGQPAYLS
jgi:hypothetical protein